MKKNNLKTRVAAFGLAAAGMITGFTGCDKDKKNTEPSKENKESVVTTVDMPSKTEPVVITTESATTEPATTEIATTEPATTEIATTEPVVETTEEKVEYINLNNVKLIELSLDTGNYYYTMEINSTEVWPELSLKGIVYYIADDDYYYASAVTLDDIPYKALREEYIGMGLSEGCSGYEITITDMNDNKAGVISKYIEPNKSSHLSYTIYSQTNGTYAYEAYTNNKLLDYKSVSAAEVFGVDELPRDKFIAFLKTLEEINFDTIVDQWNEYNAGLSAGNHMRNNDNLGKVRTRSRG